MKWPSFRRKHSSSNFSWRPSVKVGRPDKERDALLWDVTLARKYSQLADNEAFVHLFQNLVEMRRQMVESLIHDDGTRGDLLKGSIFVIDALMRLPDEMLRNGDVAERELRQRGEIDE